jgi:hypothetical protein
LNAPFVDRGDFPGSDTKRGRMPFRSAAQSYPVPAFEQLHFHPRLSAVCEFNPGGLESGLDGSEIVCPGCPVSLLEIDDDAARDRGRSGEGILIHFDESAPCAALGARDR